MKLKIKDKIFLVIVALGLIAFLYNKITGKDEDNLPDENAAQQTENKIEIQAPVSGENNNLVQRDIVLGQEKIKVRIADSEEERYQGLSDVEGIGQDEGMLFVHPEPGFYSYVMRRMNFDLDFVFILGDEIVDIKENVSKDFSGSVSGKSVYDKVLELNAGTVERSEVLVGEKLEIQNSPAS